MEILFSGSDGSKQYKLVKRDPGWELMEWEVGGGLVKYGSHKGNVTKSGWRKMAGNNGLYPHDMNHAISMIAESQMEKSKKCHVNLKDARTELTKYLNTITAAAERLSEESGNQF
jgi:hypothetical protein